MANGVILDTNCFSHVFNRKDSRWDEFSDFFDWLIYRNGYLVYGGTHYMSELKKTRYLRLFNLLRTTNKVVLMDSVSIDDEEERIKRLVPDDDFDDPHLSALVIVSNCEVICTLDSRSFRYLKMNEIYPSGIKKPKFYTGKRCNGLLRPHIVGVGPRINKTFAYVVMSQLER